MYPSSIYIDPKYLYRDYIKANSISYLGAWTLRAIRIWGGAGKSYAAGEWGARLLTEVENGTRELRGFRV